MSSSRTRWEQPRTIVRLEFETAATTNGPKSSNRPLVARSIGSRSDTTARPDAPAAHPGPPQRLRLPGPRSLPRQQALYKRSEQATLFRLLSCPRGPRARLRNRIEERPQLSGVYPQHLLHDLRLATTRRATVDRARDGPCAANDLQPEVRPLASIPPQTFPGTSCTSAQPLHHRPSEYRRARRRVRLADGKRRPRRPSVVRPCGED